MKCSHCKKDMLKLAREVRRQRKAGQQVFFCCRSCSAAYWGPRRENKPLSETAREHLRSICGAKRDQLTPFRWFMLRVRARQSNTDLTAEYLKELWERQDGLCPFTGWKIVLPVSTRGWDGFFSINASLDKIEPPKGYVKGNVRFVSIIANYAKGVWTDEAVLDFCRAVVDNVAPK